MVLDADGPHGFIAVLVRAASQSKAKMPVILEREVYEYSIIIRWIGSKNVAIK